MEIIWSDGNAGAGWCIRVLLSGWRGGIPLPLFVCKVFKRCWLGLDLLREVLILLGLILQSISFAMVYR